MHLGTTSLATHRRPSSVPIRRARVHRLPRPHISRATGCQRWSGAHYERVAGGGQSVIETRYTQVFPTFEPAEIERLRRFGEVRTYRAGDRLVVTGEVSPG